MSTKNSWEEANVAANIVGELWHKRLCHMNENGMWKLVVDDIVPEVKNVILDKCADYLADKQKGSF